MVLIANKYKTWTDILNHDKYEETGEALLYRNPKFSVSPNGNFDPANHIYSLNPGEKCLFNQTPIASGFTAYIGHDEIRPGWNSLKSNLQSLKLGFNTIDYFQNYFNKLFNYGFKMDSMMPFPKSAEEFERELRLKLIISEKEHLKASKKFYTQFQSAEDRREKENLNQYVLAFFSWLQTQLNEMPINPSPSNKTTIPGNEKSQQYITRDEIAQKIDELRKELSEEKFPKLLKGTHALAEFLQISPSKAQKLINNKAVTPVYREGRIILYDPVQVLAANAEYNNSKRKKK